MLIHPDISILLEPGNAPMPFKPRILRHPVVDLAIEPGSGIAANRTNGGEAIDRDAPLVRGISEGAMSPGLLEGSQRISQQQWFGCDGARTGHPSKNGQHENTQRRHVPASRRNRIVRHVQWVQIIRISLIGGVANSVGKDRRTQAEIIAALCSRGAAANRPVSSISTRAFPEVGRRRACAGYACCAGKGITAARSGAVSQVTLGRANQSLAGAAVIPSLQGESYMEEIVR